MSKRTGSNKDNFDQTRNLFLDLATQEFNDHGYADASTNRIVKASGMARGTLYYHFKDKQDLFCHVYERIMVQHADFIASKIELIDDPWDAFMTACKLYFDICSDPKAAKIFLVESQAVLENKDRHDIISKTMRPVLTGTITKLLDAGNFDRQNKEMLSIFIFGALGESGRIINVLLNRKMVEDKFFETFEWAMQRLK